MDKVGTYNSTKTVSSKHKTTPHKFNAPRIGGVDVFNYVVRKCTAQNYYTRVAVCSLATMLSCIHISYSR